MMRTETVAPNFKRTDFMNLNGTWEFASDGKPSAKIEVPILPSSPISGVSEEIKERAAYRRTFTLEGLSRTVLLRFGGIGGYAEIFLNGVSVGTHGGVAPFLADVSKQVRQGENFLEVLVKKRPQDEFAGIFRTVQLEFANRKFLSALFTAPDIMRQFVFLYGAVNKKAVLRIRIFLEDKPSGEFHYPVDGTFSLQVPVFGPQPWRILDGRLYTLCVDVMDGETVSDRVYTYIGFQMQKPVRFAALADPILYPRSLHTAPDVCLLKQDLTEAVKSKANALFVPRYVDPYTVHYCDRAGMGLVVEFPDANTPTEFAEQRESALELGMHPSVQAFAIPKENLFWEDISLRTGVLLVSPQDFAYPKETITDISYFDRGGVVGALYAEKGSAAYSFQRDPSAEHEKIVELLWKVRRKR